MDIDVKICGLDCNVINSKFGELTIEVPILNSKNILKEFSLKVKVKF